MSVTYSDSTLLRRAKHERAEFGYIKPETRDALEDVGYTAATIESALLNMERTNNGF
jgi:hypothetical protein